MGEQSSRLSLYSLLQLFTGSLKGAAKPETENKLQDGQHEKMAAGTALMERINANNNGSYFTKQYGWYGNQFLYMTFKPDLGKWVASLWNMDDLKDPDTYCCNMWGGSASYNRLLDDLAKINRGEKPSQ